MTGLATGPHLHYEYRIHDVPVDPLTVNIPKKTIFKGNDMVLFQQKMKEIDDLETSVILD